MIQPTAIIHPRPPRRLSTHPPRPPNFLCSDVRIRNLILDQLHIRNLVSTGYTTGDTGLGIGGGREEPDTRGILRGCLREGGRAPSGELLVETGRHTNLLNYDPRLQL